MVTFLPRHRKAHNIAWAMTVGRPETRSWTARIVPIVLVEKYMHGLRSSAVQARWP